MDVPSPASDKQEFGATAQTILVVDLAGSAAGRRTLPDLCSAMEVREPTETLEMRETPERDSVEGS